jgi:multidrug resistance efflux pump
MTTTLNVPLPKEVVSLDAAGEVAKRPRKKFSTNSIVPLLAGYALLAFVLWLMGSTLLVPVLSKRATRAVLETPVTLVTTPVSGVITNLAVHPLDEVEPGTLVAKLQNPTLNRDVLTTLSTQRLGLQSQVSQLTNQLASDSSELGFIDQQVRLYRKASIDQTSDALQVARRQREVAETAVWEREMKVRQASALLDAGAVSQQVLDAAQAQLRTSRATAAVADQEYDGLGKSLANASRGAVVSSGGAGAFQALVSRRETLAASVGRSRHDLDALNKQLSQVVALEDEERRRVDKLSAYEVKAPQGGQVSTVLISQGAFVPEGATLARMADCSRIQVVAVFPPRLAERLNVGSRLDVAVDGTDAVHPARVTNLLPLASEDVQSNYSVPFPYAEQGSVFAVAQLEGKASAPLADRDLCTPGKVVTADLSRDGSAATPFKEISWTLRFARALAVRLAHWQS